MTNKVLTDSLINTDLYRLTFDLLLLLGDPGLIDSYDDSGPSQIRVRRSSSFPVDPKNLHRRVSPQPSLDSDDEMRIRKPLSPDESSSIHPGMKGMNNIGH